MVSKTSVNGDRVMIDDMAYRVERAGTDRYAVFDEFGTRLGYFTVKGKTISADDYGIAGSPPVMQIARLWGAVHLLSEQKAAPLVTKGICEVVSHEAPSDEDLQKARSYRAWLKAQPGVKASYLVRDPATGKAMTIGIWQTKAHFDATHSAVAPEGAVPLKAASVEVFPFVEEP